ncbi:DUF2703 domain-containing protein [Methanohalophilus sp.]|uniref:DUF2703 domain-containing protein n=1 Tax=Methanohalophilus sp. TaxID=1966352 RepID=UPI00260FC7FD|nr:DUF2703 domain-containing protein [Methanohalophilus sp.]MDK2891838.1 hypothetical protein [Methanohalophilus sp.]
MNKLIIDFLYLDLSCCERCQATDETLDEVLMELKPQLKVIDHLCINKIRVASKEEQQKYDLKRSPTVRINGKDLEEIVFDKLSIRDNYCGSCSDICGEDTNCRIFEYKGETSEDIPKEMLREGLLKVLSEYDNSFSKKCSC